MKTLRNTFSILTISVLTLLAHNSANAAEEQTNKTHSSAQLSQSVSSNSPELLNEVPNESLAFLRGTRFRWGQGQNGWGYCYEYTRAGQVLNQGRPVNNAHCERIAPSIFDWGQGRNGWGYCYQWTPFGIAMNEGSAVETYQCERRSPSYFSWGTGRDGYTYCYQYTGKGLAMNEGHPVPSNYCR